LAATWALVEVPDTVVPGSVATAHAADPFAAVLGAIALMLAAGAAAFVWLPPPPRIGNAESESPD